MDNLRAKLWLLTLLTTATLALSRRLVQDLEAFLFFLSLLQLLAQILLKALVGGRIDYIGVMRLSDYVL